MHQLVLATLFACYLNGQCETHQYWVEPRACHFGTIRAAKAQDGEKVPLRVGIKCK